MHSKIKNWNTIRAFIEVSRLGSLSAAARSLGVSQPTLTRDIQALEAVTQINLFRRTTRGLELTEHGKELVEAATQMSEGAEAFSRQAAGFSDELAGDIRISANEILGVYLLPSIIADFREKHPHVHIELLISNEVMSLSKREADIALRMFKPTQPELVCRRLPDMALGFYAHKDYIAKYGCPESVEDLKQHVLIGEDLTTNFIDGAASMGLDFVRNDFAVRTDQLLAQIALARAGAGIVGMHKRIAEQFSELQPVMMNFSLPSLECWLVCHRDVQYNGRMRALMTFIGECFTKDPYQGMIL